MECFTIVWLVVAAILILAIIFMAGVYEDPDMLMLLGPAIGWPVCIVLGIVILPFFAVYQLGKFLGQNRGYYR